MIKARGRPGHGMSEYMTFQGGIDDFDYAIYDEVHTLDGPEGDALQRLILMIRCPFIALSATIGNLKEIRDWWQKAHDAQIHLEYHDLKDAVFSGVYSPIKNVPERIERDVKIKFLQQTKADDSQGLALLHKVPDSAWEPKFALLIGNLPPSARSPAFITSLSKWTEDCQGRAFVEQVLVVYREGGQELVDRLSRFPVQDDFFSPDDLLLPSDDPHYQEALAFLSSDLQESSFIKSLQHVSQHLDKDFLIKLKKLSSKVRLGATFLDVLVELEPKAWNEVYIPWLSMFIPKGLQAKTVLETIIQAFKLGGLTLIEKLTSLPSNLDVADLVISSDQEPRNELLHGTRSEDMIKPLRDMPGEVLSPSFIETIKKIKKLVNFRTNFLDTLADLKPVMYGPRFLTCLRKMPAAILMDANYFDRHFKIPEIVRPWEPDFGNIFGDLPVAARSPAFYTCVLRWTEDCQGKAFVSRMVQIFEYAGLLAIDGLSRLSTKDASLIRDKLSAAVDFQEYQEVLSSLPEEFLDGALVSTLKNIPEALEKPFLDKLQKLRSQVPLGANFFEVLATLKREEWSHAYLPYFLALGVGPSEAGQILNALLQLYEKGGASLMQKLMALSSKHVDAIMQTIISEPPPPPGTGKVNGVVGTPPGASCDEDTLNMLRDLDLGSLSGRLVEVLQTLDVRLNWRANFLDILMELRATAMWDPSFLVVVRDYFKGNTLRPIHVENYEVRDVACFSGFFLNPLSNV